MPTASGDLLLHYHRNRFGRGLASQGYSIAVSLPLPGDQRRGLMARPSLPDHHGIREQQPRREHGYDHHGRADRFLRGPTGDDHGNRCVRHSVGGHSQRLQQYHLQQDQPAASINIDNPTPFTITAVSNRVQRAVLLQYFDSMCPPSADRRPASAGAFPRLSLLSPARAAIGPRPSPSPLQTPQGFYAGERVSIANVGTVYNGTRWREQRLDGHAPTTSAWSLKTSPW